MYKPTIVGVLLYTFLFCSCSTRSEKRLSRGEVPEETSSRQDTLAALEASRLQKLESEQIEIDKDLLYDQYTLDSIYPYKDTTRQIQWEKIKERLALLENIQLGSQQWAVLQNYKNRNGEAPLVKNFRRNSHKRIIDSFGMERYQSVPLYFLADTLSPERYAQDGELARFLSNEGNFMKMEPIYTGDVWMVPQRYVKLISDSVVFNKAVFVDRHNQNIVTLERTNRSQWIVRSMNPVTTGRFRPPYSHETPLGMFVLQEKKRKMVYLKDGSPEVAGYAPYASRFTDGAYIHGVPVQLPRTEEIEYSHSLGTTPRSHMCVRNATSHAKFIFEWAPVNETIIFILE